MISVSPLLKTKNLSRQLFPLSCWLGRLSHLFLQDRNTRPESGYEQIEKIERRWSRDGRESNSGERKEEPQDKLSRENNPNRECRTDQPKDRDVRPGERVLTQNMKS